MNLNKMISITLVITFLFSILPNYQVVQASQGYKEDVLESYVVEEIEEEIKEELGVDLSDELTVGVTLLDEEYVSMEMELDAEDLNVSVEIAMDRDTEKFTVYGEISTKEGEEVAQSFDVVVHEAEGDMFHATFVDLETGEIFDVNTAELNASALPLVIIAVVARFGIQYAIKKYGKKAVENAIKSKSFNNVLSSVKNLGANKRKHIMASKHAWHKVTNNNWNDVSKVISHVMRYGKEAAYKGVRKKELKMNGHTVTVTFTRVNGKVKISNAWVNK